MKLIRLIAWSLIGAWCSSLQLTSLLLVPLGVEKTQLLTAIAASIKQDLDIETQPLIFTPRASARDDEPERREAGNKFGGNQCRSVDIPLTALVPGDEDKSFRSLTAQPYPTFWFYVPYASSGSTLSAEFSLTTSDNERVYRERYSLPETTGIVSISLPQTVNALELGQDYRWVFSVICDPEDPAADLYVSGKVQRVNPSPSLVPETAATPEERALLYAQDGLWYETLTTLIEELRPLDPQKATSRLTELLESVGLKEIDAGEIAPCCSIEPEP